MHSTMLGDYWQTTSQKIDLATLRRIDEDANIKVWMEYAFILWWYCPSCETVLEQVCGAFISRIVFYLSYLKHSVQGTVLFKT